LLKLDQKNFGIRVKYTLLITW